MKPGTNAVQAGTSRAMMSGLLTRSLALRSLRLWFGARALIALFLVVNTLDPLPASAPVRLLMVAITAALFFADVWRRREQVLIGNLGVSRWTLGAVAVVPAMFAEALFVTIIGVFS